MARFHLVLLIHAHQPVGNFDDVVEGAYAHSYLPFVELLGKHPSVCMGLHYSGSLLEWIERAHPEYFDLLRALVARRQVEMVGGGFYEPILISIPHEDRLEQIARLADYLEKHFGHRPRGAWLAERVWEPTLPSTLAAAGIEYTLVDDNHFWASGFEPDQLHGFYLAEELGATVRVIPGLKALRYLIPFRSAEENIDFLREVARKSPGGMVAMGDDCEKFGVWPGTHEHVYTNGWLEKFFSSLEANSDWLETASPGDALAARSPLGLAYLPTASYTEMMEWALPTAARWRFHALEQEFSSRPEVQAFLRGGPWRNFFSKYAEVNLLHKKMLHVSAKIRRLADSRRPAWAPRAVLEEAMPMLLRAQCNDAYWHGVFGGLYAPHLRTALWRDLIRAETLADAAAHNKPAYADAARLDFDADGREEIYLTSERYAALVAPADGGTILALDFRPVAATLINSIMRRPEPYHARLAAAGTAQASGAVSIHEQVRAKEPGLERWLRYDRWPRNAFRLLVFGPEKTHEDYESLRLAEDAGLAAGAYQVLESDSTKVALRFEQPGGWRADKAFSFAPAEDGFQVGCDFSISSERRAQAQVGLEVVINLLAPASDDRYFESAGQRHPLRWSAAVPASELRLTDEWQQVRVTIQAPAAREFWVAPIETISESEDGFERVYQGSQILTVWPAEFTPGAAWTGQLVLKITRITR